MIWKVYEHGSLTRSSDASQAVSWPRRFSNQNNPDHRHARLARDDDQLSALLRSKFLSFHNDHNAQLRSVAVDYSNLVTQIRKSAC